MLVYGRNLSPFTRRVLIWAALQGHAVERRELSPADPEAFEELKTVNPSGRVPAVRLDDGATLLEAWAICDWLESVAAPDAKLLPVEPGPRCAATQALGLGNTIAEKAVALVYEGRRPAEVQWDAWKARLRGQILGPLAALEAMAPSEGYFGGAAPNGVDIGAVIAVDFIAATNPHLLDGAAPKLQALSEMANATEPFASTKP